MTTPPPPPDESPGPEQEDDDTRRQEAPAAAAPESSNLGKWLIGTTALASTPILAVIGIPIIIAMVAITVIMTITGGGSTGDDCSPGAPNNNIDANMPIGEVQRETVKSYVAVAKALNVSIDGQVVITMTGMQESGLRILSNTNVPESEPIPHHGEGTDHDSVGSLQQRVSAGYSPFPDKDPNSPENLKWLMDNEYAAAAFFGGPESPTDRKGLLDFPGWESMPPGQAAQTVQVSGAPDAYNKWEGSARALVNSVQDTPPADLSRWKNRAGQPAGGGTGGSRGSTNAVSAPGASGSASASPSAAAESSGAPAAPADPAEPAEQGAPDGGDVKPAPPVPGDANNGDTPAATNAALTGRGADTDASTLPPGPNENSLKPNAINVGRAVTAAFPTIKDIGGIRPGDGGDHGKGMARDVMIPDYKSPQGKQLGDNIVRYLQLNNDALGIEYLMWRHHIWYSGSGWKWVEERGSDTENHMDHVHVSIKDGKATGKVTGSGNSETPDSAATNSGCDTTGKGDVGNAKGVVAAALEYIGTDYAWGGGDKTGPTKGIHDGGVADSFGDFNKIGFDCSGLMEYAYWKGAQKSIGGTTYEQLPATQANKVGGADTKPEQMKPGDLIFYGGEGQANHHVSMYVGGGKIVEAMQSGTPVHVVPWTQRDQFAITRPLGDQADENTGGGVGDEDPKTEKINLAPKDGDPSMAQWDALAECESNGDWKVDTGNGYYGGIQFDESTWKANGGDKFAPKPSEASKEEQIEVATKVYRERQWAPWPTCGAKAKEAA